MAQRTRLILALLCLMITSYVQAQWIWHPYSIPVIKGKIVDDSTGNQIAFVHVYNETSRKGYIADEQGQFVIPASVGDTIVLSALGFLSKVVFITNSNFHNTFQIRLTPQIYKIEAVKVMPFKNYEDFKKQFLALKLPKTKTEALQKYLADISSVAGKKAAEDAKAKDMLENPGLRLASVGIPILSKEDRELAKYDKVLKREARQRVIDEKYNRGIIHDITQLPEDEITDFMSFCHFSDEFLYEASAYEIYLQIIEKFKEYKLKKESGELMLQEQGSVLINLC